MSTQLAFPKWARAVGVMMLIAASSTDAMADCVHDKCVAGMPLENTCDPCVIQICDADPFCCETAWDDQCLDGVTTVCMASCGTCGDGTVDLVEACDDNNLVDGDGCDSNCTATACGNAVLTEGEACDDGNTSGGDGCSAACQIEPTSCSHGKCVVGPALSAACDPCTEQICAIDASCCSNAWDDLCVAAVRDSCEIICPKCGDGMTESSEEACDDGNDVNGDGCDVNCTVTKCGNGIVTTSETCDDGNLLEGDGCDTNCTPSGCGNGIVTNDEACDDGNLVNGDGCSSTCETEGAGGGGMGGGGMGGGQVDTPVVPEGRCSCSIAGDTTRNAFSFATSLLGLLTLLRRRQSRRAAVRS